MNFFKKFLIIRNAVGLIAVGLLFAVIGGLVFFSGNSDGSFVPLIFALIGVALIVGGIISLMRSRTKPVGQYDRVDEQRAAQMRETVEVNADEPVGAYVFHFTGKMNQSHIMKDTDGHTVYEAVCGGMSLIKDTAYTFRDGLTGAEVEHMIGHTVTRSAGFGDNFSANLSSSFTVDKVAVWDTLAEMGYGFSFSLNGLAPHYEVSRWGVPVGFVESAGTGLMNPKYKDNPIGKMPTRGIYRVSCRRSDIPGFFLICFALSRTDETLS